MDVKRPRALVRASRLNRKWTNEILVTLFFKNQLNFNAMKRNIRGISSKILSNRLKKLEKYCFVKKIEASEKMIRKYYKLTNRGKLFVKNMLDVINYSIEKEKQER